VWVQRFSVQGSRFRVWRFRTKGSGFKVQRFRVLLAEYPCVKLHETRHVSYQITGGRKRVTERSRQDINSKVQAPNNKQIPNPNNQ